ncbi:MAG TPA: type II toxin-antitoxin system RelE/ParE family toxin [Blastocatellia bacterium]|nr:type II toxin-antitoxin system RelE/ParE family toxin [Blastocatellia bacterium]
MAYRVDISPSALQDAEDAYVWVKEHAPSRAGAWYEGLLKAIYSLENLPTRCSIAPESKDIGITIRQLLYSKKGSVYRILFAVGHDDATGEDVVRVFRIRHSARLKLTPEELQEGEGKGED